MLASSRALLHYKQAYCVDQLQNSDCPLFSGQYESFEVKSAPCAFQYGPLHAGRIQSCAPLRPRYAGRIQCAAPLKQAMLC